MIRRPVVTATYTHPALPSTTQNLRDSLRFRFRGGSSNLIIARSLLELPASLRGYAGGGSESVGLEMEGESGAKLTAEEEDGWVSWVLVALGNDRGGLSSAGCREMTTIVDDL